jgi:hypothetical protein
MSLFTGTNILLQLDTDADLSGASSPKILYKKPNGSTGTWEGSISSDKVQYTTLTPDLDMEGTWEMQAQVTIAGAIYKGSIARIPILKAIV